MIRRPPRSTRTDTLLPYTTRFRSGLLGLFQGYMPPDAFNLHTSAELVIQTVMGGAGTLFGPLLGALIWLYLFEVLQFVDAVGPYWRLILGVIFVILVTEIGRAHV